MEPVPSVVPEPVRVLPPKPRASRSGMWLNLLLGIAAAVAIGGVAFAVGRSTAPAPVAAAGAGRGNFGGGAGRSFDPNASFAPGAGGFGGFGGRGGGGLSISGTVDSVSSDSITIKTANGQTVTVSLSGDTTYHEATTGTAADVKSGASVSVRVGGLGGGNGNGGNGNGGNGGAGASPGTGGALDLTATDITVEQ
jgi:hypothetical protein